MEEDNVFTAGSTYGFKEKGFLSTIPSNSFTVAKETLTPILQSESPARRAHWTGHPDKQANESAGYK